MHGPIFIQDAVATVVVDLAVLHHQAFHCSIGRNPVAFRALHVPSGVVQVTVPHLNVPAFIGRIPVASGILPGAIQMHAIGPGIGHFAVLDGQIVRAGRADTHLAGEEAAVAEHHRVTRLRQGHRFCHVPNRLLSRSWIGVGSTAARGSVPCCGG